MSEQWTTPVVTETPSAAGSTEELKVKRKRRTKAEIEAEAGIQTAEATVKKSKAVKEINPFAEALKFISLSYNPKGQPHEKSCIIKNGWITSSDGLVTCGHPINLGADFNPEIDTLKTLLDSFPQNFTIVAGGSTALFKSDTFQSHLTCLSDADFTPRFPDPMYVTVNHTIVEGFKHLDPVSSNKGEFVAQTSVRLDSSLLSATSGKAAAQYCHGWQLPVGATIPKLAAKAVVKSGKVLIGLGYDTINVSSITFYFADGAWLKTQLFTEPYPDVTSIFDGSNVQNMIFTQVPANLFTHATTLKRLSNSTTIFFREGSISNYPNDEAGSTFEASEIHAEIAVAYEALILGNSELCKQFGMDNEMLVFRGDLFRVAISKLEMNEIDI